MRAGTHELEGPLWMLCWEEVVGGRNGSRDQLTGYCGDTSDVDLDYSSGVVRMGYFRDAH